MPQKTLRFKIHQDGRVEETVEGFTGNSCKELALDFDNIIISRTFSKAFALASFRVGYTISSQEER